MKEQGTPLKKRDEKALSKREMLMQAAIEKEQLRAQR